MAQQCTTIAKTGIHAILLCKTTIVAAANPIVGSFKNYLTKPQD